jgi:hypothetical protein
MSVEIKALTVSKKQMTKGVFRQLPRRHVIEPGRGLRGDPWGIVYYFWDDCGYPKTCGKHLHVVWAGEGRLFRACVDALHVTATCEVWGDPQGLKWLGCVIYDDESGCPFYRIAQQDGEIPGRVAWWTEQYNRLAALDQLFISV